jgi:hypothetical protein
LRLASDRAVPPAPDSHLTALHTFARRPRSVAHLLPATLAGKDVFGRTPGLAPT